MRSFQVKSKTYSKVSMQHYYNVHITIQDITKEGRHCIKSQTPEVECAEGVFLTQSPICTVNFTNVSMSGCT